LGIEMEKYLQQFFSTFTHYQKNKIYLYNILNEDFTQGF
jgi:hypothetical protein